MKILITGASGFIGQNLVKFLNARSVNFITASHKSDRGLEKISSEWLDDHGVTIIIHLAGIAHDIKNVRNSSEYFKVNRDLTCKLFDEFNRSSYTQKFIFLSSVKAAVDEISTILTEDIEPQALSVYGRSKYEAEKYIMNYPTENKKQFYILRPAMVHGEGNKGNLNLLFSIVKKGFPWPLGGFINKRSFCSIDNLLFVFSEVIQRDDIPSGIYNVCDSEMVSTNELIQIIGKSINRKTVILKIPKSIIIFIAQIGSYLNLPFNRHTLSKLTNSFQVSNIKLINALGKNLPVSCKIGLEKTFFSFNRK